MNFILGIIYKKNVRYIHKTFLLSSVEQKSKILFC